MDARALTVALAAPCALLAAGHAVAQDRGGQRDQARMRIVPSADADRRMLVMPERQRARLTSLESWTFADDAEISLGRFRVIDRARPLTNMERERAPLQMEVDTRGIAGAGFRFRF